MPNDFDSAIPGGGAARPGRPVIPVIFDQYPVPRVLEFLDDRTSLWERLSIMTAYEPGPLPSTIRRRFFLSRHG
jgi:hypothetical protein